MDRHVGAFNKNSIESRRKMLERKAREFAALSSRWKTLFELASRHSIKAWTVVGFMYSRDTGKNLSQAEFAYARVAKLLATTESAKVKENLNTKKDLVNWNRQAILAMIEAIKREDNNSEKIERGYKAIEFINILFPEFLLK